MDKKIKLLIVASLLKMPFALAEEPKGNAVAGKALYTQNCVVCHGTEGKGDGVAAAGLNPKPANFSDPARASMTEEKQVRIVSLGGAAEKLSAGMPGFGDSLNAKQISDVVAFIRKELQKRSK